MIDDNASVDEIRSAGSQPARHLGALTDAECLELLTRNELGRVGFTTNKGPQIYPVNYSMDRGTIVIRTSPYAGLYTSTGPVAFEIDEIDPVRRQGWSVLVVGTVAEIEDPDEAIQLRHQGGPEPWASGQRNVFVRITPREITGRRLA